MIVIAGDSWGCGEWDTFNNEYGVVHKGLEKFLKDSGKKVINISRPAGDNCFTLHSLTNVLNNITNNPEYVTEKLETVLVFQTEWIRDYQQDITNIGDEIIHIYSWYRALSNLALKNKIRIGIIGGLSDTIYLEKFEIKYPGLFIACQSLTNLLITDSPNIKNPVYTVNFNKNLLQTIRSTNNDQLLDYYLNIVDNGLERQNVIFRQNKDWFYPDGKHPNQHGHKKLYDFLRLQKIL